MTESIKFLEKSLSELYDKFSYLEIKYEYRPLIDAHIVEVKPIHCFESDRPYKLEQINIQKAFKELFPYEDLLFMTESILFEINDPILSLGVSNITVDNSESLVTIELEPMTLDYMQCIVPESEPIEFSEYIIPIPLTELKKKKSKFDFLDKLIKKDPELNTGSFFFINIATW